MKIRSLALLTIGACATATMASAQTLGSAADYDIFALNNGKLELKDGNQLFGNVGISNGAEATKNEDVQNFEGAVYVHTGADFSLGNINPSGGIFTSGFDGALDQANTDLHSYAGYLGSLSADVSYTGTYKTALTFASTGPVSVIDLEKVDAQDQAFTFTGRAGQMDQVIIRVSEEFKFEGGSVVLNNLKRENVIWFLSSDKSFDLHKGFSTFEGTIVAPDAKVILGETEFTGKVYGHELKLGSGFSYQVPEPSSSMLLVAGAGGLLLTRRRKQ